MKPQLMERSVRQRRISLWLKHKLLAEFHPERGHEPTGSWPSRRIS